MTIRKILTEPNKTLRQVSLPVDRVGKPEQLLMDDMLETMYAAPGIGLAAIQVGILKRLVVIDISKEDLIAGVDIIGNFLEKSILSQNNLSVPETRISFVNLVRKL